MDHSLCARHSSTISPAPTTIPWERLHCPRGCVMCIRSHNRFTLGLRFNPRTLYHQSSCCLSSAKLPLSHLQALSLISSSQKSSPCAPFNAAPLNEITAVSPSGEWPSHFASNLVIPIQGWQVANSPSFLKMSLSHLWGKKAKLTFCFSCDSLENV